MWCKNKRFYCPFSVWKPHGFYYDFNPFPHTEYFFRSIIISVKCGVLPKSLPFFNERFISGWKPIPNQFTALHLKGNIQPLNTMFLYEHFINFILWKLKIYKKKYSHLDEWVHLVLAHLNNRFGRYHLIF